MSKEYSAARSVDSAGDQPQGPALYAKDLHASDRIARFDDAPDKVFVEADPNAYAGLVVYGYHAERNEWIANWGERHVIRRLLAECVSLEAECARLRAVIASDRERANKIDATGPSVER
jgi:hypothetical protein